MSEYQRAYRAAKKEAGECRDCSATAIKGQVRCIKHATEHRERVRGVFFGTPRNKHYRTIMLAREGLRVI